MAGVQVEMLNSSAGDSFKSRIGKAAAIYLLSLAAIVSMTALFVGILNLPGYFTQAVVLVSAVALVFPSLRFYRKVPIDTEITEESDRTVALLEEERDFYRNIVEGGPLKEQRGSTKPND